MSIFQTRVSEGEIRVYACALINFIPPIDSKKPAIAILDGHAITR